MRGNAKTIDLEKPRGGAVDSVQDTSKDAALNAAIMGPATTGYETLTAWETVKMFKLSTAV